MHVTSCINYFYPFNFHTVLAYCSPLYSLAFLVPPFLPLCLSSLSLPSPPSHSHTTPPQGNDERARLARAQRDADRQRAGIARLGEGAGVVREREEAEEEIAALTTQLTAAQGRLDAVTGEREREF